MIFKMHLQVYQWHPLTFGIKSPVLALSMERLMWSVPVHPSDPFLPLASFLAFL